jgi:hypothetical protein
MRAKLLGLVCAAGLCLAAGASTAEAGYYGGWNYHPTYQYHYCSYHYTPTSYHYAIYHPTYPRYYYYYNPYRQVYWGRFDREGKPGQQYSQLAEKDQKGRLSEIPESAFPPAGEMPSVPGTTGNARIEVPPAAPTTAPPAGN